jgi:hypothetical protein
MKRAVFIAEGVVQVLISVGAIVAGIMMIAAPDGHLLQMPLSMLKNSPFRSFLVPGIILLLVNGIGNLLSAILCFQGRKYAAYVAEVFGFGLIIWVFVQVSMIGGGHWLPYIYFSLGILVALLGTAMRELDGKG